MTYCGIIKKNLKITVCPLKPGRCLFQHRQTNECKYTGRDLTLDEYCQRVGQDRPDDLQLESDKLLLLDLIKKENQK